MMKTNRKRFFSNVLEPVTQRIVTAEHVLHMQEMEMSNIDKIEFSPPKLGADGFGKFKVKYKTPFLCEVDR